MFPHQYGKCTLILFLIDYKVGSIVEAIMDDLLLFTPSKKAHIDKLEDLLKALRKKSLKISPKKCQLFRTELTIYGKYYIYKRKKGLCKAFV